MLSFLNFLACLLVALHLAQANPANALTSDNKSTALSTLVRTKRQLLYLCGAYPNQYYSRRPCYTVGVSVCSNGGRLVARGCVSANQCAPYYRGPVACLRSCCCTVPSPVPAPPIPVPAPLPLPLPQPTVGAQGYCPGNELSNVRCSAPGQCASSQSCMSGLCCTRTVSEYTVACAGQAAITKCTINRQCQSGFQCTAGNYCCQCPVGQTGGRCNRGLCRSGYTCHANGWCCPSCPGNVMPFGVCRSGVCGGGRRCAVGNICC